jgi:hypothetical protein
MIRSDKGPKGIIRFKRCCGRTDPEDLASEVEEMRQIFEQAFRRDCSLLMSSDLLCTPAQKRLSDPAGVIDKLIPEAASVTEEITVDFFMIAVPDPAQFTVPLTRKSITAGPAMDADGRRSLQVPCAGIMTLERLVCENTCGTDFRQIAAENILQKAVFVTAEIDVVVRGKDPQVAAACVITVKPDAAVTVYAAVHFMVK